MVMEPTARILSPGPNPASGRTADGRLLHLPPGWTIVPPGDATLTRRIKATGQYWVVQEKKGRKVFSHGVWAPSEVVDAIRGQLTAERGTPAYTKQRARQIERRQVVQENYVANFRLAVLEFLDFDPRYHRLAEELAEMITSHATPIGSGTVARTERIPLEQRAELAVIAWMRHQTTAYDSMSIRRVRGERREVRRMLAVRSREVLESYRHGEPVSPDCPLRAAVESKD